MFEYPETKRVKRTELFPREDSEELPTEIGNLEGTISDSPLVGYGFEYDFIQPRADETSKSNTSNTQDQINQATTNIDSSKMPKSSDTNQVPPGNGAETYEFRLFHTRPQPTTKDPTSQFEPKNVINLNSRSASPSPLTHPHSKHLLPRPSSYYFTSSVSSSVLESLRHEYTSTAISSAEIYSQAETKWPGMAMDWKVIHIPISKVQSIRKSKAQFKDFPAPKSTTVGDSEKTKKKRMSKKRRILSRIRRRGAAKEDAEEETQAEKRNRKNREKKARRREKVRQEKKKGMD